MAITLKQAKQRILNKWDWEDNNNNYPVILWGPIGIGKTHLIYSLVCERMASELKKEFYDQAKDLDKASDEYKSLEKELNKKLNILDFKYINDELMSLIDKHCLILRLGERPIEQLQGVIVPSLSEKSGFAKFIMPENFERVKDSKWGIVFLDELDKATDAKFGAATHILENKVVGDFALGDGWYVIAAANREEDSHLSNPVPPELRNRCANIEVDSDLNTWINWAVEHDVRKDIIMFHKFNNGEWLSNYDLDQTYSFPSPRSWVMASRVIDKIAAKMNIDHNNSEQVEVFNSIIRNELIDFVGKQAQAEFFTYREMYLRFNAKAIIEGKERIPTRATCSNEQNLISDQCIAAFAVGDQIDASMFVVEKASEENGHKAKYNKDYILNLVNFIQDLLPEIRTIYLRQIYNTRIINIIMDSGLGEDTIDELMRFIAS